MKQQTIDLHLLESRYAHIRVKNEARVRRLADSISRHGQLEPMLVVSASDDALILIDGYQRLAALRYLGQDTGLVRILAEPESESLYQLLIHRGERQWELIEEAGLIQELHRRFEYSLSEIGQRIGREKSYVKRRMDLLESLPNEILSSVIAGQISTWAASRVLIPLARANASDAVKLAAQLEHQSLSTRDLNCFYEHYQKANRQVRTRMLESPALFIKTLKARTADKDQCPEAKWLHDAQVACAILSRLQEKSDTVFYPNQEQRLRRQLLVRVAKACRLTAQLHNKIKECLRDDQTKPRTGDQGNGQQRHQKAIDCQTAQDLPQYSRQGAQDGGCQGGNQQGIGL